MEELVKDNAFIRPSASGEHWVVWLEKHENQSAFEACGFDTIIIETVGVVKQKLPFTAW
jgi:putative protein kinase ArgK-like GTPase of G3E family